MSSLQGRVLITGASGFIGAHLSRRLLAAGYEVHGTSRSGLVPADARAICAHAVDLGDADQVRKLVMRIRPDHVFHLASAVTGDRAVDSVQLTLGANLVAAVNLMTALVESSCRRLVLVGSQEEPDWGSSEVPCSPYAAGKWAASGYARMFHALYQLPVVLARIFMVYGPAQRDRQKLIPYLIESMLRGEAPRLSSGQRPVDWVYVDDVVEGLIACAERAPAGESIDLGSGELVTIRGVVELLVEIMEPALRPQFGTLADRAQERVRCANIAQAARLCGWAPQATLGQGLRRTVAWYRAQAGTVAQGLLGMSFLHLVPL